MAFDNRISSATGNLLEYLTHTLDVTVCGCHGHWGLKRAVTPEVDRDPSEEMTSEGAGKGIIYPGQPTPAAIFGLTAGLSSGWVKMVYLGRD